MLVAAPSHAVCQQTGDGRGREIENDVASVVDLREYFGREAVELQLPEDATSHNLFQVISTSAGGRHCPHTCGTARVHIPWAILLLVNKKVVLHYSTVLCDGQEVTVLHALAGG